MLDFIVFTWSFILCTSNNQTLLRDVLKPIKSKISRDIHGILWCFFLPCGQFISPAADVFAIPTRWPLASATPTRSVVTRWSVGRRPVRSAGRASSPAEDTSNMPTKRIRTAQEFWFGHYSHCGRPPPRRPLLGASRRAVGESSGPARAGPAGGRSSPDPAGVRPRCTGWSGCCTAWLGRWPGEIPNII